MSQFAEAAQAVQQGANESYYRAYAAQTANRIARARGIDPARFTSAFIRLIDQESGFDPEAYNASSGASGIAQIMPQWHPNAQPWNAEKALEYGAGYLADMIGRYGGDFLRGTAAYNYGPQNVDAIAGMDDRSFVVNLPGETQTYVKNILGVTGGIMANSGVSGGGGSSGNRGNTEACPVGQVRNANGECVDEFDAGGAAPFEPQPPGKDAYGRAIPQSGLPPGWSVNQGNGELLPPSSSPTGGGGIPIGELFGLGDTVFRWTGTSITKATVSETKAYLAGGYGGGGGGYADDAVGLGNLAQRQTEFEYDKGIDQRDFAYGAQQDELNRILDTLAESRMQAQLGEIRRQNQRDTLMQAAPFMTAGRDTFGGFQQGGPAQALANFGGVGFLQRSTDQAQVPLDVSSSPVPLDPQTQALLNRLLGPMG